MGSIIVLQLNYILIYLFMKRVPYNLIIFWKIGANASSSTWRTVTTPSKKWPTEFRGKLDLFSTFLYIKQTNLIVLFWFGISDLDHSTYLISSRIQSIVPLSLELNGYQLFLNETVKPSFVTPSFVYFMFYFVSWSRLNKIHFFSRRPDKSPWSSDKEASIVNAFSLIHYDLNVCTNSLQVIHFNKIYFDFLNWNFARDKNQLGTFWPYSHTFLEGFTYCAQLKNMLF